MKYTVLWLPTAESDLAATWIAALDRQAVTRAAHRIEQQLQHDPRAIGESRTGETRIVIEEPLGALYEIIEDDRRVVILSVWLA